MPEQRVDHRYGAVAQTLHWIIAALIVTQFVLASMADDLPAGMQKLALLARHKSVGMTVLMLAVVRLAWRLFHKPPPLPPRMKSYEVALAKITHGLFYVLLFAIPLSGWMMSSAKGYTVSWFNLFAWPNLVPKDQAAFKLLRSVHETVATTLFFVAILHILASLKHHFWDKDDVLKRMLPFTNTGK
jgi:cytochrome b561